MIYILIRNLKVVYGRRLKHSGEEGGLPKE